MNRFEIIIHQYLTKSNKIDKKAYQYEILGYQYKFNTLKELSDKLHELGIYLSHGKLEQIIFRDKLESYQNLEFRIIQHPFEIDKRSVKYLNDKSYNNSDELIELSVNEDNTVRYMDKNYTRNEIVELLNMKGIGITYQQMSMMIGHKKVPNTVKSKYPNCIIK